jgi:hypothetical protein
MPSIMEYRNGPLLWMTLPHMLVYVVINGITFQFPAGKDGW